MEVYSIIAVLAFATAVLGGAILVCGKVLRLADEKEKRLLALVKNMADRLSAKDLTGYMALQSQDNNTAPPGGRSDAEEAALERERLGL